jgi:HAD superfamily hydrolase (TIGR01450 family)
MSDLQTIQSCDGFLLDMDGTLYVDDRLLSGARALVAFLDEQEIPYLFLTNNSSHSASFYQDRLHRLGIESQRDRILTSGDATIEHLLATTAHRSVYIVGTPELEDDFRAAGFRVNAGDSSCVVAGFDTTLTYEKLERACALLFEGKAFYATHPDRTCITERGLIPDVAAIIGACTAVTGRIPTIIGKPNTPMVRAGLARLGTSPGTTAIVGDQLDTDMTMAQMNGLVAVLVMSGETTPESLAAWPKDQRPALCARDVAEVLSWLR